jgi:hypothetical protein
MKQSDIEISKLRFNPFDPKTLSMLEEEFGEFDFGVDKKKAVIYLILFYDLKSPFIQRYPDVIERRLRCADIAEFPKKDKVYDKKYENLIVGDNEKFNDISFAYIKSFGSPEYVALHIFWKYFGEQYLKSSKTFEQKEYKDSIANIKSLLNDINKLTEDLFSGHESLNMRMALYKGIENENKLPRPETIAQAEDVKELINNPYGKYEVEPLRFKSHK